MQNKIEGINRHLTGSQNIPTASWELEKHSRRCKHMMVVTQMTLKVSVNLRAHLWVNVCLTCPVSYFPCCFTASNTPTVSKIFPSGLFLPESRSINHNTPKNSSCRWRRQQKHAGGDQNTLIFWKTINGSFSRGDSTPPPPRLENPVVSLASSFRT